MPRSRYRPLLLTLTGVVAYSALVLSLDLGVWMTRISAPGSAGWYALAILSAALVAATLSVADVVRSREQRGWGIGLLLAELGYAAANVGAFVLTLSADRFAIFDRAYVLSVLLIGPALAALAVAVLAALRGRNDRRGMLGFDLWAASVGCAHFWVVAQASASV